LAVGRRRRFGSNVGIEIVGSLSVGSWQEEAFWIKVSVSIQEIRIQLLDDQFIESNNKPAN